MPVLSIRVSEDLAEQIIQYIKKRGISRTKFFEQSVQNELNMYKKNQLAESFRLAGNAQTEEDIVWANNSINQEVRKYV